MITNLDIPQDNVKAHLDIENEIQKRKNGHFTCVLRVDNGRIVDYNVITHVTIRDYLILKKIIIQEFTIAHHAPVGNTENPVLSNNNRRTT